MLLIVTCLYPCVKSHNFFTHKRITQQIIMEFNFGDNHFTITLVDGYNVIKCMNENTLEIFETHFNQFHVDDFMENVYAKHYNYNAKSSPFGEKSLFGDVIRDAFGNGKVVVDKTDERDLHILVKLTEINDVYRFVMKRNDWKSNDLRFRMCINENALLKKRIEVIEKDLEKING